MNQLVEAKRQRSKKRQELHDKMLARFLLGEFDGTVNLAEFETRLGDRWECRRCWLSNHESRQLAQLFLQNAPNDQIDPYLNGTLDTGKNLHQRNRDTAFAPHGFTREEVLIKLITQFAGQKRIYFKTNTRRS